MPRQELLRSPTKAPTKSPTKSPKKSPLSPLRTIMMGRGAIFKSRTNFAKLRRTATSDDSGPDEGKLPVQRHVLEGGATALG
jgi:hypothetical protein